MRPPTEIDEVGVLVDRHGAVLDLFVELDRTRKPARNLPKFAAYDAFITAWSAATPRYQSLSDRPLVVFVCDDEPQARAFCRAADSSFTGRIITLRTPPDQWRYPGRERAYFCCERDVHEAPTSRPRARVGEGTAP